MNFMAASEKNTLLTEYKILEALKHPFITQFKEVY